MKKRLVSMLLALVMVLGMLPVTALAAGSEEEALGEVNIYNGEQKLSYLSINGRIRELIYTYFNHVDANGRTKEIPAYCVNPNIYGVPQTVSRTAERENTPMSTSTRSICFSLTGAAADTVLPITAANFSTSAGSASVNMARRSPASHRMWRNVCYPIRRG